MKIIEILLLGMFVMVLMSSSVSAGIIENLYTNATLLLDFDINVSQDSSRINRTGEVIGNVKISTEQKKLGSSSAYFDGSGDLLNFTAIGEYKTMQNFSIGCWTNYTDDNNINRMMSRESNVDSDGDFGLDFRGDLTPNQIQFRYVGNIGTGNNPLSSIDSVNNLFADNSWKLIGASCNRTDNGATNGGTCYLIVNATLNGSDTYNPVSILANTGDVCVGHISISQGKRCNSNSGDFHGGLDGCFIINKSLTWGDPDSDWNKLWNNGEGKIISQYKNPTISLNNPNDKYLSHNLTFEFKFNISDEQENKINYSLFISTSSDFTQNMDVINSSNNTLALNGTVIYTFYKQIEGSINGTYYWKINGSDLNTSNFESLVFNFNITNNISSYNITNVSLTALPIEAGNIVKLNYNITNLGGSQINDNISLVDIHWYINNTYYSPANNLTTLSAGNVTPNANITGEIRINNGFGETAWTQYVNSSHATVGDTTAPTFKGNRTSMSSVQRDLTIDIFVNSTDNIAVDIIKVEVNNSQIKVNFTMSLDSGVLGDGEWKYTYTTSVVGTHRLVFYSADGSSNTANTGNELTFDVTAPPSSSDSGGGGGGGGNIEQPPPIIILGNLSLVLNPPIIAANQFFFVFPEKYKRKYTRFAIDLVPNKLLDKCISDVFECSISNNVITAAYNYSNSSVFIGKVQGKITLIDKASLAKTIDASVRFINLGYALPINLDIASKNYLMFRLENINPITGKGRPAGIRIWIIITITTGIGAFAYLYSKERLR